LLVPTDFSAAANAALLAAIPWLDRFQAELHLVHVFSPDYPAPPMMVSSLLVSESQIGSRVRSRLEEVAQNHALALKRVSLHASCGRPYEEICRLARRLEIDLIVTATRGTTGLKHLTLGSTAERVIRYAPCPVLVVHPDPGSARRRRPVFKKVLVPIDFSACAAQGLAYGRAIAAQFGSRLVLLHTIDLSYYSANPEYIPYDLSPLLEAAEKSAREQMLELIGESDWDDLEVEHRLENGHAGEQICRSAQDLGADLIVTSTHGRTGLKRILLGSTAEYIVRHAPCPVLVVPSHERRPLTSRKGNRR
jgi:nucleotide-binding universal stress UspA family protein